MVRCRAMAARKKTVNGITRSLLLTQEQDRRLEWLCQETEMNRNALVRLVAEQMTPREVRELAARR